MNKRTISNFFCHYTSIAILFLLMSITTIHAQERAASKKIRHRVSVGFVKSFYKNEPNYTINTKAQRGYNVSYKTEIVFKKKTNLLIGIDYFNQGVSFNSYYEAPGHTYIFDNTFPYHHEIRISEVDLPVMLKVAFNSEKENYYTPYFVGGIGARYIYSSYTYITNDSTDFTVFDQADDVGFVYELDFAKPLLKKLNAFYQLGLGIQRNFRTSSQSLFFELTYRQGFSRLDYDGNNNSNKLYIKDRHLLFSLGVRL